MLENPLCDIEQCDASKVSAGLIDCFSAKDSVGESVDLFVDQMYVCLRDNGVSFMYNVPCAFKAIQPAVRFPRAWDNHISMGNGDLHWMDAVSSLRAYHPYFLEDEQRDLGFHIMICSGAELLDLRLLEFTHLCDPRFDTSACMCSGSSRLVQQRSSFV